MREVRAVGTVRETITSSKFSRVRAWHSSTTRVEIEISISRECLTSILPLIQKCILKERSKPKREIHLHIQFGKSVPLRHLTKTIAAFRRSKRSINLSSLATHRHLLLVKIIHFRLYPLTMRTTAGLRKTQNPRHLPSVENQLILERRASPDNNRIAPTPMTCLQALLSHIRKLIH
jgi:hypothetical protein